MIETIPLPATPPQSGAVAVDLNPMNEEFSKELREHLENEFLPNYTPRHQITGDVDKIKSYSIHTNQPLPALDSATAKAYVAIDANLPNEQLYALICEPHLPVRQDLAKLLLLQEPSSLIQLKAEGVVKISTLDVERYVLIYERPVGKTLYEVVNAQQQTFPDRYVREKVVTPLNQALLIFEKIGYSHGKVNPHNIYIHDGKLTLGECCSEPCSYRQDFHYEPISQIQAHPAGKGSGSQAIDYYAVGVIVTLMKLKTPVLETKNKQAFIRRLLQEGSYLGVAGYIDLSDEMNDILRGTLNDNVLDRWGSEHVTPWCKGKRYNLLTPSIPSLGGRPFEFENQSYQNLRQLANAMYLQWDKAITVLEDTTLARWVEQSTRRREISEYINRVVKSYRNITDEVTSEIITRSLYGLDRLAPIRLQSVSTQPDGANVLFAELYHQHDAKLMGQLKEAIAQSIFGAWQEAQRTCFSVVKLHNRMQQAIWALDRARLTIKNTRIGFGEERVLYELNPLLPCQSPILQAHYVTNLSELIVALDHVAKKSDKPTAPIDRHIAGFIGAKLPLNNVLMFDEYSQYPELANHQGLLALKFLEKSQMKVPNIRTPGLAAWLVASITDAIGAFHSKTVRKELSAQLMNMAKEGNLSMILQYLTAYDYSAADTQGFAYATEQYEAFGARILAFKDEQMLEFRSFRAGNMIAKFIAYLGLTVVTLYFYNLE